MLIGCAIYVNDYYPADDLVQEALVSNETVTVMQEKNTIAFVPEAPTAGFIFLFLGGSMAASYVANAAEEYEGLVLLASYSTADLCDTDLRVICIYGSENGVLNREKYAEYAQNLPAELEETVITGGCHANFGSYGIQKSDGTPSIS